MLRGFAQNMNSKYLLSMLSCQRARLFVFATQIHTPPFVAARHLPPARGKSFLKGRGLGIEMKFAWTAKGSHFGGAVKADRH